MKYNKINCNDAFLIFTRCVLLTQVLHKYTVGHDEISQRIPVNHIADIMPTICVTSTEYIEVNLIMNLHTMYAYCYISIALLLHFLQIFTCSTRLDLLPITLLIF